MQSAPGKCRLFQQGVKYLGHVVSRGGVSTDHEKTQAVRDWPVPTTVRQVCSFLGCVGYYRRFVPSFSRVAAPLTRLLQGTAGCDSSSVAWSVDCQNAFDKLKQALLSAPILAYADFTQPFKLYIDASFDSLGAVLSQVQEGHERVIAYACHSLVGAERNDQNYSSYKLELLVLKWAVTDKFKDYPWGAQFTIYTDNNPLVQLNPARLGAVEQRWVSNYTFDIKYHPGATNQNADLLSRLPEVVHDVVRSDVGPIQAEGLQVRVDEPQVPVNLWKERQQSNSNLTQLRGWLRAGKAPPNTLRRTFSPWLSCMLQEWDQLQEQDGVLYRCAEEPDTRICTQQVIVPVDYTRGLWAEYHHAAGHSSAEKVLSILRKASFGPG